MVVENITPADLGIDVGEVAADAIAAETDALATFDETMERLATTSVSDNRWPSLAKLIIGKRADDKVSDFTAADERKYEWVQDAMNADTLETFAGAKIPNVNGRKFYDGERNGLAVLNVATSYWTHREGSANVSGTSDGMASLGKRMDRFYDGTIAKRTAKLTDAILA